MENRATTSFGCCSSTASLPVRLHCMNARRIRHQADLTPFPWSTGGDHRDAPVLRGWRLPSRTWNHWTSPWTMQLTWLRIVHSGEWCLRLALCTHSVHYALIVMHARNELNCLDLLLVYSLHSYRTCISVNACHLNTHIFTYSCLQ